MGTREDSLAGLLNRMGTAQAEGNYDVIKLIETSIREYLKPISEMLSNMQGSGKSFCYDKSSDSSYTVEDLEKIVNEFKNDPDMQYDVFICSKVSDTKETLDFEYAELFHKKLSDQYKDKNNKEKIKPLFSEIDLNKIRKGSNAWKKRLLYALMISKCLLIVCNDSKYLSSRYVFDEISFFLKFNLYQGHDNIVVYSEQDNKEFFNYQNNEPEPVSNVLNKIFDNIQVDFYHKIRNRDALENSLGKVQYIVESYYNTDTPSQSPISNSNILKPETQQSHPKKDNLNISNHEIINESPKPPKDNSPQPPIFNPNILKPEIIKPEPQKPVPPEVSHQSSILGTTSLKDEQGRALYQFGRFPQDADGKDMTPINWIMLDDQRGRDGHGKVLLLSEKILYCYNHVGKVTSDMKLSNKYWNKNKGDAFWHNSEIKKWLNGDEFLNRRQGGYQAFTQDERDKIVDSNLGKLFLLSVDEVHKYLKYNNLRECKGTNFAKKKHGAFELFVYHNNNSLWWLRSPGASGGSASRVHLDGSISASGVFVDYSRAGVRPAFWLNL